MKHSQSHVVAGVVGLAALGASYWISMTGVMQKYTSKPDTSFSNFDPTGMVGHGDLVTKLLKLLSEVDGEPGSVERLASARRVEAAILAIEAKIERSWTEQGKKQLALIAHVRSALKEEIGDKAEKLSDPSETITLFTLFACGVLGWASTKWVNSRYASFAQSRFNLKMKENSLEYLDELDEGTALHKGSVTPKGFRKGGVSPKNLKSKTRNVRRQQTSSDCNTVATCESPVSDISTAAMSCEHELGMQSGEEDNAQVANAPAIAYCPEYLDGLDESDALHNGRETPKVYRKGGASPKKNKSKSKNVRRQQTSSDCYTVTLGETPKSEFSTASACCECELDMQRGHEEEEDAHVVNASEVDASSLANESSNDLECGKYSIEQSMEQRGDVAEEGAVIETTVEPLEDDEGCVYAPCTPGGPMHKFWPVFFNGEQFYTDGALFFQMACLPVEEAPEASTIDSDGSATSNADNESSTTADSDSLSWGAGMTRSHSEPSFSVGWIE